jgi:hypothetical protein
MRADAGRFVAKLALDTDARAQQQTQGQLDDERNFKASYPASHALS